MKTDEKSIQYRDAEDASEGLFVGGPPLVGVGASRGEVKEDVEKPDNDMNVASLPVGQSQWEVQSCGKRPTRGRTI